MDLNIKGRTALVFGGGGGLGSAIAMALAREEAKVVLADIDRASLDLAAEKIKNTGGDVNTIQWDLGDLSSIDEHIGSIQETMGSIGILVNNTGGPPPTPASGQDPQLWRKHFDSMVVSVIAITDRVLPGMRQQNWGRVITSSSSGILAPIANLAISNALRLSLVGWSKTLAREVAADGVTVNIVVPGRIATRRTEFLDRSRAQREKRSIDDVVAESSALIPLGRYGRAEEYADVVTFLASARASYVTGAILRVDGGMIAGI